MMKKTRSSAHKEEALIYNLLVVTHPLLSKHSHACPHTRVRAHTETQNSQPWLRLSVISFQTENEGGCLPRTEKAR